MNLDPSLVKDVLPELFICSQKLYSSGFPNQLFCEMNYTTLHCYAQLSGALEYGCQIFVVIGSFNYI